MLRFSHHYISITNQFPTENSTDSERGAGPELKSDEFSVGNWLVIELKSKVCLKPQKNRYTSPEPPSILDLIPVVFDVGSSKRPCLG